MVEYFTPTAFTVEVTRTKVETVFSNKVHHYPDLLNTMNRQND